MIDDDAVAGAPAPKVSFRPAGPRPPAPAELRKAGARHLREGRLDAALDAFRAALRAEPRNAGAWSNLGAVLRKRGERTAAVSAQRRAHALAPDDVAILGNLGNALHDADRLAEAEAVRREVVARRESPDAWAQLCVTLRSRNRLAESIAAAERGLALAPDHAELIMQRAMGRLGLGDYPGGFDDYRRRWEIGEITKPPHREPEWNGEDPSGRSVLVLPEQGHGDTLLMARFLPALRELPWREVHLAVKAPLHRLLGAADGADRVLAVGGPKPRVDHVLHMLDLPRLLGATPATLPPAPRLTIPEASRSRARQLLAPFADRLKVGVVWSGSTDYRANFKRSFDPGRFLPLTEIPGVQLVSLYKGPLHAEFHASGLSALILDASGTDRDFADAAGLVEALDLVIGVDTGVTHLAASLGRETWTLLAHAPYWVYAGDGPTTPWHPSMRLFRQPAPGDWDAVFTEVETALRARAGA